jgi:hypothetical protein
MLTTANEAKNMVIVLTTDAHLLPLMNHFTPKPQTFTTDDTD